jgi:hypothetical protein
VLKSSNHSIRLRQISAARRESNWRANSAERRLAEPSVHFLMHEETMRNSRENPDNREL